ncbi:DNA polymerase III subunit delta' [Salisediminibacterium beveridgei]|uniref:DNA polymerase III subunit delta' n=1 Tax=Salisediminibacterium beveridgei TaxID=632773 RepID=A0A1D7R059_9BACI|nr:DNA polymerase III subunit delta' [Salisediminibacterium beveridgei]AOM84639.1 DNA polymerase III delta prime subunit [Salisediminibacterium beveridgei]
MGLDWTEAKQRQPRASAILARTIEKDRLAHAYLFEGSRGTGKMAIAELMAQVFLCRQRTGIEPCNECADCKRVTSGNHPDVHVIEAQGAVIKVDQIRGLKKEFSMRGMESGKKVYLVKDADRMNASAGNSLLKFLEEPDGEALAILTTTRPQGMLKTILSRVQVMSFQPLSPDVFVKSLVEHGVKEQDALLLSRMTANLDEALALTEEDWIAEARKKVIQLLDDLVTRPGYSLISLQDDWVPFFKEKPDVQLGIDLLILWYRDLLRLKVDQPEELVYVDQEDRLWKQAVNLTEERLANHLQAVVDTKRRIDANTSPQLAMEQMLIRLQEG